MSGAEDFIPEGSMVIARIEIVEIIDPDGEEGTSFYAVDQNGDALSSTRFMGLLMLTMMDGWQAKFGDDEYE